MSLYLSKLVKRCEVPQYLRLGTLYSATVTDDITVPAHCIRNLSYVETLGDVEHLLITLDYWGIKTLPIQAISYLMSEKPQDVYEALKDHDSSFPALQEALSYLQSEPPGAAIEFATRHGRLECVQYLVRQGVILTDSLAEVAASGGHVDCLKYLLENGCIPTAQTWEAATSLEDESCLQCLHSHGGGDDDCEEVATALSAVNIAPDRYSSFLFAQPIHPDLHQFNVTYPYL